MVDSVEDVEAVSSPTEAVVDSVEDVEAVSSPTEAVVDSVEDVETVSAPDEEVVPSAEDAEPVSSPTEAVVDSVEDVDTVSAPDEEVVPSLEGEASVSPPSEALGGVPPKAGREAPEETHPEEPEPALSEEESEDPREPSGGSNGKGQMPEFLVDLDEFEDDFNAGQDTRDADPLGGPSPEPEKVLVSASAGRSGGLLGAVRSAFALGRAPHEHIFVDVPGGMGITRHICSECGHISISVTD